MKGKSTNFKAKHDEYLAAKSIKVTGKGKEGISNSQAELNRIEKLSYLVLRAIGIALISFSFIYLFFVFFPIVREELSYIFAKKTVRQDSTLLTAVALDDSKKVAEEASLLGLDPSFSIYVPKIDAKGNIAPNVDTSNEAEYLRVLKKYVAHARGSYFPGQGKMIYLFSHSTDSSLNAVRYNAVFYLLTELKPGDLVIVFYANGKYIYRVSETSIRSAIDTSFLNNVYSNETLVLQTCYPPGTTLKRFLVFANRLDNKDGYK